MSSSVLRVCILTSNEFATPTTKESVAERFVVPVETLCNAREKPANLDVFVLGPAGPSTHAKDYELVHLFSDAFAKSTAASKMQSDHKFVCAILDVNISTQSRFCNTRTVHDMHLDWFHALPNKQDMFEPTCEWKHDTNLGPAGPSTNTRFTTTSRPPAASRPPPTEHRLTPDLYVLCFQEMFVPLFSGTLTHTLIGEHLPFHAPVASSFRSICVGEATGKTLNRMGIGIFVYHKRHNTVAITNVQDDKVHNFGSATNTKKLCHVRLVAGQKNLVFGCAHLQMTENTDLSKPYDYLNAGASSSNALPLAHATKFAQLKNSFALLFRTTKPLVLGPVDRAALQTPSPLADDMLVDELRSSSNGGGGRWRARGTGRRRARVRPAARNKGTRRRSKRRNKRHYRAGCPDSLRSYNLIKSRLYLENEVSTNVPSYCDRILVCAEGQTTAFLAGDLNFRLFPHTACTDGSSFLRTSSLAYPAAQVTDYGIWQNEAENCRVFIEEEQTTNKPTTMWLVNSSSETKYTISELELRRVATGHTLTIRLPTTPKTAIMLKSGCCSKIIGPTSGVDAAHQHFLAGSKRRPGSAFITRRKRK
jgi:hypothetical protein